MARLRKPPRVATEQEYKQAVANVAAAKKEWEVLGRKREAALQHFLMAGAVADRVKTRSKKLRILRKTGMKANDRRTARYNFFLRERAAQEEHHSLTAFRDCMLEDLRVAPRIRAACDAARAVMASRQNVQQKAKDQELHRQKAKDQELRRPNLRMPLASNVPLTPLSPFVHSLGAASSDATAASSADLMPLKKSTPRVAKSRQTKPSRVQQARVQKSRTVAETPPRRLVTEPSTPRTPPLPPSVRRPTVLDQTVQPRGPTPPAFIGGWTAKCNGAVFQVKVGTTSGTITGDGYHEEFFILGDGTPGSKYSIQLADETWDLTYKPSDNICIWHGQANGNTSTWTRVSGNEAQRIAKAKGKARAATRPPPPASRGPTTLKDELVYVPPPRRVVPTMEDIRNMPASALNRDNIPSVEDWPDDGFSKTQLEEALVDASAAPFTKTPGMTMDDAF